VAAVGMHGGRVLLSRGPEDDFWALPGGRVRPGEPARDALARELFEELVVTAPVGRLLWIAESFFSYRGDPYHELGFYFLADLASAPQADGVWKRADEAGVRLAWTWCPVARIAGVDVRPAFLRSGLADLPASPVHVVHRGP